MAGFGLELEGHVLVVFGHDLAPEAPGFPGDALAPLLVGQPPLVLLLAVPPEADLPHDALKQLLDVVLDGRRGLDELAIEHHGTRSPFWWGKQEGERRVRGAADLTLHAHSQAGCGLTLNGPPGSSKSVIHVMDTGGHGDTRPPLNRSKEPHRKIPGGSKDGL